jgi:4-amino-4-deoxy-L-arabinose transferase-like glycosyltransferase
MRRSSRINRLGAHLRNDARTRAWLLIAAICTVTFFAGVGTTALWEPDEPRFAEATRQMLARGDYITPWFNDQPRFEKPPLLYWLQLPFFVLLGDTETAARMPSVLAGLAAALAIFAMLRESVSVRAGLLGAAVLATSFRFVLYARQGLTDVPVTAAITVALWAMSRAVTREQGRASAYLAWVCVGAAILLKGPVGLFAPLIWTAWALWSAGRQGFWRTRPIVGPLIAALVALPWYAAMIALHGRRFVDVALGYEIVARYLSADFPGKDRGFFYFWGAWLGDGAPWSLFLIPAVWWGYANRDSLHAGEKRLLQLAVIWFMAVLLLFSLSQYKLPHYILPAYPAMALAIGLFANAAAEGRVRVVFWRTPMYLTSVAMLGCAVLLWLLMSRVFELRGGDPSFVLPVLFGIGAIGIAVVASMRGQARPLASFAALAITLIVIYGLLGTFIASRELRRFQPVPELAAAVRAKVGAGEPLAVAGNYGAPGLVFYTHHPVRQLIGREELVSYLSGEGRRHCVLPEAEFRAVEAQIHRPVTLQAEAGVFSVRMRRLLERDPERAARVLMLVSVE